MAEPQMTLETPQEQARTAPERPLAGVSLSAEDTRALATVSRPVGDSVERPLLTLSRPSAPRELSPREQYEQASTYAVLSGTDFQTAFTNVQNPYQTTSLSRAATTYQSQLASELDAELSFGSQEDLVDDYVAEEIATVVDNVREASRYSRLLPESLSSAVRAGAIGSEELAISNLAKVVHLEDAISEFSNRDSMTGLGDGVMDFAELIVDPLWLVHVTRMRQLVDRLDHLFAPGVDTQQFEEGVQGILREAADLGFLSEENMFLFETFVAIVESGSNSNIARAETAMGAADALATILGGASSAAGTLRGASVIARTGASGSIDAARDLLSRVTSMRPSAARDQVIRDTLNEHVTIDSRGSGVVVPNHTAPSSATPSTARGTFWSAPSHTAMREFEMTSQEFDTVVRAAADSGRLFDQDTFYRFALRLSTERVAYLRSTGSTRVIDVDVGLDDLDNIVVMDLLGTQNGTGYLRRADAQRLAGYGDEVIPLADGTFAIGRRQNLSATTFEGLEELGYTGDIEGLMLFRATDPDQLGDGFWARRGSPLAQADPGTSGYMYRAESVMQRVMRDIDSRIRVITRGMSRLHRSEVYSVFEDMASGRLNHVIRRDQALNEAQFRDWFRGRFQREATDSQVALYLQQQARLDSEVIINADLMYRRAVDMDARTVRASGSDRVEYQVVEVDPSSLPSNARYYDVDGSGQARPLSDLPAGTPIYRNVGRTDFPANVQYIAGNTLDVRSVRHSDFVVRNSGGHRAYQLAEAQFFIKQPSVHTYDDGSERINNPNTLMATRTREEADAAIRDINTIVRELNNVVNAGRLSREDYLDALEAGATSALNTVVRNNNGFNRTITNVRDLVSFARDHGLDLRILRDSDGKERNLFRAVGEGDDISDMADLNSLTALRAGHTARDNAQMALTMGGRGDAALIRYGGEQVTQRGVQEVMDGAYAQTIHRVTEASYRARAGWGLIKGAIASGVMRKDLYREIAHLPLRTQLERIHASQRNADNNLRMIDTSGASGAAENIGRKFELDLERLMFRLRRRSWISEGWNSIVRRTGNFLYGKAPNWMVGRIDRWSTDPLTALRGFTFDAYLGMFNVDQVLMQAQQVINIVPVAGMAGARGAAMYPVVRFAFNNGSEAVIRNIGKRIRSITGLDEDQFLDLVESFRRSGRGVVDNNIAELTASEDAASGMTRSLVSDIRTAGRVFFREGDLVARITAYNAAYLEAVAKFGPRTKANTQQFDRFINWREQTLTQAMTAASRQGYEHLPFMQFMSYQLRINEAIFAGTFGGTKSVLTGAEKFRLGVAHLTMYGLAGTGLTSLVSDYMVNRTDIDMSEGVTRLVRIGMVDAVLTELLGLDTAARERYASGGMIENQLRQIFEGNVVEYLAGPPGQLGWDVLGQSWSTLVNATRAAYTGETLGLEFNLQEWARTVKTGDKIMDAMYVIQYGRYLSNRGGLLEDDADWGHAVAIAMGVTPEDIATAYSLIGDRRVRNVFLDRTARRLTELSNRRTEAFIRGDHELVRRIAVLEGQVRAGLSPSERERVDRQVWPSRQPLPDSLILDAMQSDISAQELLQ